jgi:sugar lactone lactonase YvrE
MFKLRFLFLGCICTVLMLASAPQSGAHNPPIPEASGFSRYEHAFMDTLTPSTRVKAAATTAVNCIGGMAGIFPCKDVASPAVAKRAEPFSADDGKPVGRGSVLNGPNGVDVGPDGNLYVASFIGDEITVHHPQTGAVLDRIGPERGVHGPDDLVIAADGTIYWTEFLAGNVGMLRPDGSFRTQFVARGVNPIALSDGGRLFVARDFLGNGLYELDLELLAPPQVVIPDLVGFNGMDFGPDGLLYGPLFFGGAIARIDVDAPVPTAEIVATGFRIPGAVAFNSAGELYAVDFAEGQVIKVDVATGDLHVLADIEGVLDNLAFDATDRLFTTALADGQILTMTPGGTLRALNKSGFIAPSGVAAAPDGTVWVADFFSLRGFGSRRNPVTSFYYRFDPPFAGPARANTVAADGDLLITTAWSSNSLQVLDPDTGAVLEDIRTLAVPSNAIRHGDALVAAQVRAGNIVDAVSGEELLGGLVYPLGLASDGENLYVSDWASGVVWALTDAGSAVPLATGLSAPEGLALDGNRLLVVEEGLDQVSAIDLTTSAVRTVIEGLDLGSRVVPAAPPHGIFNGVTVAPNGSIYVSDDGANAVYEFKRKESHRRREPVPRNYGAGIATTSSLTHLKTYE